MVPSGDDFATTVLGDPWDMNQTTDIYRAINMANISFSGGIFQATTTSHDAYFWLLHQGYPSANNINPHCGLVNSINASLYHNLSFLLYRSLDNTNVPIRVYWYKAGDELTGQPSGRSRPLTVSAGWRTYQIDLSNPSNVEAGVWSGNITGLRIDPTSTADPSIRDVLIQLDWVRLTATSPSSTYQIQWTGSGLNPVTVLTLVSAEENDPDNRTMGIIATDILAVQQSSYSWPVSTYPPGNYYVQSRMGTDYAGVVRGRPWDMSQLNDIAAYWNSSLSQDSGGLNFIALNNDPAFSLAIDPDHPVNAQLYKQLTIRMYSSTASFMNFYWTPVGGQQWSGNTSYLNTSPGWHTYTLSLPSMIAHGAWSGLVKELRVDFATSPGVQVTIDWIALTTGDIPSDESDLGPSVTTGSGILTINDPPVVTITAPSMTSGPDYATTVLGDPWDMTNSEDISWTHEVVSSAFTDGIYTALTAGGHTGLNDWGDSQLWMHLGPDSATYIDTSQYKYLSLRACYEGIQDVGFGWVFRLLWAPNNFGIDHSTSDDFIIEDGWPTFTETNCWQTYKINMAAIRLEPDGGPNFGWVGNLRVFRLDPTEIPYQAQFKLDWMKLTAMDQVRRGNVYTIQYELKATPPVTLSFYYDTDTNSSNGRTLIGTSQVTSLTQSTQMISPIGSPPTLTSLLPYKTYLPFITKEPCSGNCYNWNTSGVPAGTYYICLQAEDPYNSTYRCSEAPIVIQ